MNKTVIIYQSKYGTTQRYVEALQRIIPSDCFQAKQFHLTSLSQYDTVIFAGGLYAGMIAGFSVFKKNSQAFLAKQVIVLAVGFGSYDEAALNTIKSTNLKELDVPFFYVRGALDIAHMTLRDRTLIKVMRKAIAKKDPSTLDDAMKALQTASDQPQDWYDEAALTPLIQFLQAKKGKS